MPARAATMRLAGREAGRVMTEQEFAIVFDLDGLLVDSEPVQAEAFNEVLGRRGHRLQDEDFIELVGYSTYDNWATLRRRFSLPETAEELLIEKDVAYHALLATFLRPMPGAIDLVRALAQAEVPMAVASSSPRRDVLLSLQAVGLIPRPCDEGGRVSPVPSSAAAKTAPECSRSSARDFGSFEHIVTADDVERTKPAPDLYLEAARRLGRQPRRCVALEDTGAGLEAACAAGMPCVAVPHRYTTGHDFSRAARIIESLADLTPADLRALVRHPTIRPG